MNMTQVTAALFQLQQIDLELDRLKAEKQSIASSLQGSATLRRLRAEYDTARQQTLSGRQMQKEAEWTLDELNRRLAAQEQRLYNGSVHNTKELQSLQQEVQNTRAQQSRQEERLLELIDIADSLVQVADRKAAVLHEAEEKWQQESLDLQSRIDQLEEREQGLEEQRQLLISRLDATLVTRYDNMRKAKQGRAVSRIEQNSCQWCRVLLTASELQKVRLGQEIQTCLNCGRILFYER